jgi:Mrp family chromosome partitioning ATPase
MDSPIPAALAESDQVSTAVLLQDMFPTGMSRLFLALQAGVDQMAVEAAPLDVPPIGLDSRIPASQAKTEMSSSETVPSELSPAELDSLILALQAEVDLITSVPVSPNASPADLGAQIPGPQAEIEMSSPEIIPPELSPAEMDSLILAQLAEVVQVSSAHFLPTLPAADEAPQIPPSPAETDRISTAPGSSSETQTETIPPVPDLQAESEQLSTAPVSPDVALASPVSLDTPDVRSAPSEPAQEVAPTRNSMMKPVEPAAGRRVSIRLPAESRLVALTKPEGLGAEKFRALVTRLEHHHKPGELKSFQVTSSVINEGKTLISANIAVTLAKHFGSKTLLVEGDLHRPTLAPLFGLHRMRGLSHWWSGRDPGLAQFVHGLDELPLWFLPAGEPCDRASDILRSARFVKAFEELASQFEWIVVDSTPMAPIVDVNLWSRLLDGTKLSSSRTIDRHSASSCARKCATPEVSLCVIAPPS